MIEGCLTPVSLRIIPPFPRPKTEHQTPKRNFQAQAFRAKSHFTFMSFISDIESGIQSLFAATNAGFRNDGSTGQQHVANWMQTLRSSNNPALAPIVAELDVLNLAINRNDPAAMAAAFQKLGTLTAASALQIHTFEGTGDKLRELSQKLITAAGNLRLVAQAPVAA